MSRTYPAKRSHIARGVDFPGCTDPNPRACQCSLWVPTHCLECGEEIHDGDRVIDTTQWDERYEEFEGGVAHAACANEAGR